MGRNLSENTSNNRDIQEEESAQDWTLNKNNFFRFKKIKISLIKER